MLRKADMLAVAPYFSMPVEAKNMEAVLKMSVEEVLDATHADLIKGKAVLARQMERATKNGLKLIAYEGGQHLVGVGPAMHSEPITELLHAANRHPRMYDLYREHHRLWTDGGGGLYVFYQSTKAPAKSGSWGLQEREGQPLESAHKLRAVREIIEGR